MLLNATADQILSSGWRQLYSFTQSDLVRGEWKKYAQSWHPDHCKDPRAAEVMAHITQARDRAINGPTLPTEVFDAGPKKFSLRYLKHRQWELGQIFTTESAVVYHVTNSYVDLAERAARRTFHFVDDRIRDEMTRFLPNLVRTVHVDDGRLLIYRRNRDQILLADLLESEYGVVEDVHVMWMISALLNICSYLYTQDLTHFGLSPEMMLVSPSMHSVALTGPCPYMTAIPERPPAVPAEILAAWPQLRDKKARLPYFKADLQQIRRVAMRALGVHDFASLRNAQIHEGLRSYLSSPPSDKTIEEYQVWVGLRGKRKFVEYNLKPEQVYDLG